MHSPSVDPLLWTKEDFRLDLKVDDLVVVNGRRGVVVAICQDKVYPVKVMLDGDTRETRPIGHSIKRVGEP